MALKPRARNPRGDRASPELFRTPPEQVRDWIRGPYRSRWGRFFKGVDAVLRVLRAVRFRGLARQRAIDKAVAFVTERLNGEDGLGGIYPAIANSVMMFDTLGYAPDHPHAAIAWRAVRKLLVVEADRAYCQPCLSPVWDTGLAGHAVAEAEGARQSVDAACAWLRDAADHRCGRRLGGAPARPAPGRLGVPVRQSTHYPDVDDTAVVGMLLHRNGDPAHARGDRSGARLDHRHAVEGRKSTAAGARSSRRTRISISTTSRSPIMARCSIRRPPT